jgi:hypothetical protein
MMSSAISGELMRFEAATGMRTPCLSGRVAQAKPPRGTACAIVGTRASCQPMPELSIVVPAASSAFASARVSPRVRPPSTRSSAEMRKTMMNSVPTACRVRRTISVAKRIRFSSGPPQGSLR